MIKNKQKRQSEYIKKKQLALKEKMKEKAKVKKLEKENPELKEERLKRNVVKTLENTREKDETIVNGDEEVMKEIEQSAVHSNPKLLVTTSRRATADVYEIATEFASIFPNAEFVKRGSQFEMQDLIRIASEREYTCLIVLHHDRKEVNALTIIQLPEGPSARFTFTSWKPNKAISGHGNPTEHKPELILNNFNTRLGFTIGSLFKGLFPLIEEFTGRQVCTWHNQRDFIFFRRHR
jgi:ribosome production factor 1